MRLKKTHAHNLPLPAYGTAEAAGADICSAEDKTLQPLERYAFATGWQVADIPIGFEIQCRPRSGLAFKHGLTILNAPGTIDSDYRGEIKVVLCNVSNEPYQVRYGERIAQLVIGRVEQIPYVEDNSDNLRDTARGSGGFGSTGYA